MYYYGFATGRCSANRPCHDNRSYLMDALKLLEPKKKKNYTSYSKNVSRESTVPPVRKTEAEVEIDLTKLKWKNFVLTISDYPSNKYSGRGIVSSASSGFNRYRRLIASIKLLRWLKCRLPVEVFMHPGELKEDEIREFQRIPNVTVCTLTVNISLASARPDRFAIKPGSILQSSFEHVLWLDSDNIAVHDPEYLFDLPHYTRSTAMFWPDFWSTPSSNAIWKILDIPYRMGDYDQESGQIVINKRLAWKALNLALYFNSDQTVSKLIYGDKDTFRLSWRALDIPFYFIRKYLAIGGFNYVKPNDKDNVKKTLHFCGHTMIQHDPLGKILFLHANLVKFYNGIKFPIEKTHLPLKKYENPWRVFRRYANSTSYLKPDLFQEGPYLCATFRTDGDKKLPPLLEDDFHKHVSPHTTAQYLSYLNGSIIESRVYGAIDVVDRNWPSN